jgi:hypothetical protein
MMKNIVQLAVLSTTFISGAFAGVDAIYGVDNRQEVYESSEAHQILAQSTASMIAEAEMSRDPSKPGLVQLAQHTLRDWLEGDNKSNGAKLFSSTLENASGGGVKFCEGTRFVEQSNPAMCSGFLIAPDLIVTAGHCVEVENFCENYRWVFDFKTDKETQTAGFDIKEEDIYKCKKVVSNALINVLGLDYGVIQLDRQVTGREPLEIRNDQEIDEKQEILVIGNPSGLPTKVAAGANVRNTNHPSFFSSNLDTFQGNSGSAVFNAQTGVVEGILVRGEEDYVPNYQKMCIEAKVCDTDDCRGEDVTRITAIPEVGMQKALISAATSGNMLELASILENPFWIDFYTKDGQSALIKASAVAQIGPMKELISKGADVNLQDASGNTSLHALAAVLDESRSEALNILVEAGAQLEIKNALGESALLVAGKKVNLAAAKLLILAGADKNAVDNNGEGLLTAFIKAGDQNAVAELIKMGVQASQDKSQVVQN